MKALLRNIVAITAVMAISLGCHKALKDPMDYYPITKITSATVQSDGTVLVEGEVVSPGKFKGAEMEYVGFCASSNAKPGMTEHQIIAELNGNKFSAVYPAAYFDEDSTYQISSWGTNGQGYFLSEPMSFDSLFLDITPPCTIPNNYYNSGGNTGYYSGVVEAGTNLYWASNGNDRFSIEFDSPIHVGIYTTYTYAAPGKVRCGVDFGGWNAVENGATVYVAKLSATSYQVTICSATFQFSSVTLDYSSSFTIQL